MNGTRCAGQKVGICYIPEIVPKCWRVRWKGIQMTKLGKLVVSILLIAAGIASTIVPVAAQSNARAITVNYKQFNAALSPDGKTLAIAADPAIYGNEVHLDLLPIRLIDLASGKESGRLEGTQTDFATGLTFTTNGKQLVSSHGNGQLNIWDVSSGKVTKTYQLPSFSLRLPRFLLDGKHVALLAPGNIAYVLIFDTSNGAITAAYGPHFASLGELQSKMTGFPAMGDFSYSTFDVSPDGKTIATATLNDEVDLWDMTSGKMSVLFTPSEKKMLIDVRSMSFTPDGKSLVYYNYTENKLHVWDLATQKERDIHATGGAGFGLNAKGNMVAWIDKSQVYTWDFKAGQPTKIADIDTSLKVSPSARLFFTPDNKEVVVAGLATGGDTNQIYVIPI